MQVCLSLVIYTTNNACKVVLVRVKLLNNEYFNNNQSNTYSRLPNNKIVLRK